MTNLVIIGSGMAAYTLAREYRKLEKDRVLYLITADDGCSYSKPTLSNALAKKQRPSSIAMASAEKMAQTLAAEIQPHTRVTAIDTANKKLQLDNGKTLAYGQLVLALGAEAIPASLEGNAAERVMSVNSLADYSRFHEALEQAHHVSVIGPGLIGCEFANDLAGAGKNVTVIGPGEAPLGRLLPSEAAQDLKQALTGLGVEWRLGALTQSLESKNGGLLLGLNQGEPITTDLVISAIGLKPSTSLAKKTGLSVARGIVVDRRLQTSEKDVYAIGDCAEVAGLVLPFVLPIMYCARALAQTLVNKPTEVSYPAMPVVIKTPACPIVVSPPPRNGEGQWQLKQARSGVHAEFRDRQSHLLGFALTAEAIQMKQTLTQELPPILA